jgi:glycosyltransferase involved in cell wall biosynthesis
MKRPSLSLVVPVYNEEENLSILADRLREAVQGRDYEILFIDDGSTDKSFEVIRALAQKDQRVRCIRFRRNFGQTAAISAGIETAQGDVIVPLDADLQNDPADIPHLIERLEEGYDVVSGWRRDRKDKTWTRVIPSKMANWLISRISGVHLHDYGCTLKAYRREVIKNVRLYGEMHRFIPIYAAWEGGRVTEIEVEHHPRRFGQSKYGINRTVKVLLDLVTIKFLGSYATKPIYMFGGLGMLLWAGGAGFAGLTLYHKLALDVYVHRNPFVLLSVFLMLVGMQFVMMGVLAEILIRIYHEARKRPVYSVRETLNIDETD